MAFFLLFITSMAVWVAFAVRQDMDLVRKDYYEEEMRHQQQIDRTRRAREIRAQVGIAYDAARQILTITLPAAHVRQETAGQIRFYRPSDAKLDQDVQLALNPDGTQQIDTSKLRGGLWKIRLFWNAGGDEYYFDQSVTLRRNPS